MPGMDSGIGSDSGDRDAVSLSRRCRVTEPMDFSRHMLSRQFQTWRKLNENGPRRLFELAQLQTEVSVLADPGQLLLGLVLNGET